MAPFDSARDVLRPLAEVKVESDPVRVKAESEADVLQLCNIVMSEVLTLGKCKGVSCQRVVS